MVPVGKGIRKILVQLDPDQVATAIPVDEQHYQHFKFADAGLVAERFDYNHPKDNYGNFAVIIATPHEEMAFAIQPPYVTYEWLLRMAQEYGPDAKVQIYELDKDIRDYSTRPFTFTNLDDLRYWLKMYPQSPG